MIKIIATLGLALALLVGGWSTAHAEGEIPGTADTVSTTTGAAEHGPDIGSGAAAAINDDGMLGAASCMIGVLCPFLVFVLVRVVVFRARRACLLTSRPIRASLPRWALPPSLSSPPSLTQLSISRT